MKKWKQKKIESSRICCPEKMPGKKDLLSQIRPQKLKSDKQQEQ